MKRTKRKMPSIIAVALVLSSLMVLASTAFAATNANVINATPKGESIHKKIDISDITGEIAEPPQLTSAASSIAKEKEWYEYVYYSKVPVGYCYLSDGTRLAFYDPYDYSNSLIMEVNDDITDWSSMNTLQVSYTTGNSVSETDGTSTDTSTTTEVAEGNDKSTTKEGKSKVVTTVEGRVKTYNDSKQDGYTTQHDYWVLEERAETEMEGGIQIAKVNISASLKATQNWGWDRTGDITSESNGWTEDNTTTTAENIYESDTVVTTEIAKRVSTATGSSTSASVTMSTDDSKTITKTYEAAYFNANGSPLQWKIIHYKVMMPMKYQVQYLIDDEWVFGDYSYCLLTTIQGTCRSWLQNNVAYYEHWGTGEPVTWDEFWNQFFTKENLIKAYQSKLYPEN